MMDNKKEHYFIRTFKHIERVRENALYLIVNHRRELGLTDYDCRRLALNVLKHDASKFSDEQFQPYVDFTWCKHTGGVLSKEQVAAFEKACQNHYEVENHHPEGGIRRPSKDGLLGQRLNFSYIEVIECACDLQAMADEFGERTYLEYFTNQWSPLKKQYFPNREDDWESNKKILLIVEKFFAMRADEEDFTDRRDK